MTLAHAFPNSNVFAPLTCDHPCEEALPCVEVLTFQGAGHIPHATDPDAYVEAIIVFVRKRPA
jgi:pimeloyl-ACP methyl ester carboxylesterase